MYPICKPRSVPRQPGITRRVESPTPLHYAAADGDVAAVHKLLAEGADSNATAYFGMTPLHVVVKQYSWRCRNFLSADRWAECAKLLLEAGANPMLRCMPDTTPAGLGDGFVPPILRDAMVVLAERGVWRDDDRNPRERWRHAWLEAESEGEGCADTDFELENVRPGSRCEDARQRLSPETLELIEETAKRLEESEQGDRLALNHKHVRIGWWTKRKPNRHARAPKRGKPGIFEVAMA